MPAERWLHAAVALAAFLGHVFPRGSGSRAARAWPPVQACSWCWSRSRRSVGFLVYAVLFAIWRVSSVGSLAAGVVATAWAWLGPSPREYATLTTVLMAMMIYTHRGNIRRIAGRAEKPV